MKKIVISSILFVFLCSVLLSTSCTSNAKRTADPDELVIVAHVTIKPEFKDDIMKAFEGVVEGTRKEPGNISYILYQDVNNPLKFTFVEIWKSQAAIEAHNSSAHFQVFAKAIDGKADLEVYTMKEKL